jgi:hypothetical protein
MIDVTRIQAREVPQDVIKAAQLVRRWVDTYIPDVTSVTICAVGVRTFLSVETMLDERRPNIFFSELAHDDGSTESPR